MKLRNLTGGYLQEKLVLVHFWGYTLKIDVARYKAQVKIQQVEDLIDYTVVQSAILEKSLSEQCRLPNNKKIYLDPNTHMFK